MTSARLTTLHTSLKDLIRFAYHAKSHDQIVGGPSWIDSTYYDLSAAWPDDRSLAAASNKLPLAQRSEVPRYLMQSLLADRFQLKAHIARRNLPVYALIVAKGRPKLAAAKSTAQSLSTSANRVVATAETTHTLADFLSTSDELGGHLVLDETRLNGTYDFKLDNVSMSRDRNPSATSIFAALPS